MNNANIDNTKFLLAYFNAVETKNDKVLDTLQTVMKEKGYIKNMLVDEATYDLDIVALYNSFTKKV